jgi:hypothetical protein
MSSISGFVVGLALARAADVKEEEQTRMGIVGGLMPSPLLGALVVQGLISGQQDDDDGDNVAKGRAADKAVAEKAG